MGLQLAINAEGCLYIFVVRGVEKILFSTLFSMLCLCVCVCVCVRVCVCLTLGKSDHKSLLRQL